MAMSRAGIVSWAVFFMQISTLSQSEARLSSLTGSGTAVAAVSSTLSVEDWTHGCPKGCICKWISGKRTAECEAHGWERVPTFELPDRIQVLELSNNPISSLPDQLFRNLGLINVQKMFLQSSNISQVHPNAFQGLEILIELDLRHNGIRQLHPGTFRGNKRIRKLWLSHNPLHTLSSFAFPAIPHLRILDLSHTRLSKLGRATFMELEFLEVLHLHDNHFHRLDKRVFLPMHQLKSLTLERNPWLCDCRLLDFWQWLMKENLFNLPTACATPKKLHAITWDKLSIGLLACPPEVYVPEPMVTVSTGTTIHLGCLVTENPGAEMSWVRSGIKIANNSKYADEGAQQNYMIITGPLDHQWVQRGHKRENTVVSVIDGGQPQFHSRGRHDSRKHWYNLTIENVHPSGSGGYTCVAENSGGQAQGNVTVVYSETVATYLENSKISALLVIGTASGVMVFLCLGTFLVCLGIHRKHELSRRRREQHLCLTASGPKMGSSLVSEMEGATRREVGEVSSVKDMCGSTSFCVARTKSFRLQKQQAIEAYPEDEDEREGLSGSEFRTRKKPDLNSDEQLYHCLPNAQLGVKSTNQIKPSSLAHQPVGALSSSTLDSIDHKHLSLSSSSPLPNRPSTTFADSGEGDHHPAPLTYHARDMLTSGPLASSSLIVKGSGGTSGSYSMTSVMGSDADSGRGSLVGQPSASNGHSSSRHLGGPKSKTNSRDNIMLSSASEYSSKGFNLHSQSVSSPSGQTTSPMDSTTSSCSTQSALFSFQQNLLGSSSTTIVARESDQGSTASMATIKHRSFPSNGGCSASIMDSMWQGGMDSSTHLFDDMYASGNSGAATPNGGRPSFWSSASSPCNVRTASKQSASSRPNFGGLPSHVDLERNRARHSENVIRANCTLPRGENLSSSRLLTDRSNGGDFRAATLMSDRRARPMSSRNKAIHECSPTNHLETPLHSHGRPANGATWESSPNERHVQYFEGAARKTANMTTFPPQPAPPNGNGLDTELLVQEIEARRELLEALVNDKHDTVV